MDLSRLAPIRNLIREGKGTVQQQRGSRSPLENEFIHLLRFVTDISNSPTRTPPWKSRTLRDGSPGGGKASDKKEERKRQTLTCKRLQAPFRWNSILYPHTVKVPSLHVVPDDGRLHKVRYLAGPLSWVIPSMEKGALDMAWNNTKFIHCFWGQTGDIHVDPQTPEMGLGDGLIHRESPAKLPHQPLSPLPSPLLIAFF